VGDYSRAVGLGVWKHHPVPGLARLMEPFGASRRHVREAKPLKDMVGTRRLELLTSTVSSVIRFYNDLQVRGDCLSTRKSCKTSHFVGWVVG
jgi:hypothetical protein